MSTTTAGSETHHRIRDHVELPRLEASELVTARARRDDEYPIVVTLTAQEAADQLQRLLSGGRRLAIITDATVEELHGRELCRLLRSNGIPCQVERVPPGEESKSLEQAERMWDWLAHSDIARLDYIVTLGGGVINDLGGFVAAVHMRGLPYINLPTTLLAQVDGAMGGKVAVNHRTAKNLLGAFHQPKAVISNVGYLATLDERHTKAGLAESIKKAVIASPDYFDFIEAHLDAILDRDLDALEQLVRYAAKIKTLLVERDPYEEDLRRPLNFGHTIGHPVETVTGYGAVLHGEAVAFGMIVESRIAMNRGTLPREEYERLLSLLTRAGLHRLPVRVDEDAIIQAMAPVERIRDRSLRWVLWESLGITEIVDDVTEGERRQALHEALQEQLR